MKNKVSLIGKILYSICFLIIIPMLLLFWAGVTEELISYPAIHAPVVGGGLISIGVVLMLSAMFYLKRYGKGLPMNAYPPTTFVKGGPFKLFKHPIYWGFVFLLIGYFLLTGSASGLWLVTPVTILSIMALIWGYEKLDLEKRFPTESIQTLLALPPNRPEHAHFKDRLICLLWIVAMLVLTNYLTQLLVNPVLSVVEKFFALEIFKGKQDLWFLNFVFVMMVPFFIARKDLLWRWSISGLVGISLTLFITLTFPDVAATYLPSESAFLLRTPLYMIFISLLFAARQSKRIGIIFGMLASVLIFIQWPDHSFDLLPLLGSILIFILAVGIFHIWELLRKGSETIANSWHEWRFGKIRIINHGFYVGFAAFFSIFLSGYLAGKGYAWAILVFAITVIVFSAIWAQVIEGSEKLKRPYGYYGALVGIIFGSVAVWFMGYDVWVIIGVVSVVMPWAQGIGRLRCLINGCCHGSKTDNTTIGIRYFHFRSRVCGLSDLKGKLLHPTPLYAIIWLFFVGIVLLSLWIHNFSSSFIFGLYLILTGIGRFVEEAYRGEVQTLILKGLRLYQWTAIASVLIGILMTMVHQNTVVHTSEFTWQILLAALIGGLFTTFAMGVDFPDSNARFSRLV